jgi:hypothetical protein
VRGAGLLVAGLALACSAPPWALAQAPGHGAHLGILSATTGRGACAVSSNGSKSSVTSTTFECAIKATAAEALGIPITPALQTRADTVLR